ncbi:hypothetical protein [Listeria booriae]|uniref:hypothetical protein n=1 Tax=Listeria booriae TaxID=1552123 RepID=UPI00162607B0|nr:hypothetical protein [Listeria booriae]MBC2304975.1 hypothetical protein [Listeria booriae]
MILIFSSLVAPILVEKAHTQYKSETSVRIPRNQQTSSSHILGYAPLPASPDSSEYKRFRSIGLKQKWTIKVPITTQ